MTELEILTADNYFRTHPQNIMGTIGMGTTRWGEEISIVKSDDSIREIADRIIGNGILPEKQPWHLNDLPHGKTTIGKKEVFEKPTDTDKLKNVREAIEKTQQLINNPPDTTGLNIMPFDELQRRYGGSITKTEYEVWTWYQQGRLFSQQAIGKQDNGWFKYIVSNPADKLKQWVKDGYLCYDGTEFLPATLFFAGNIYNRMAKVKEYETAITEAFGKEVFENQYKRLEESVPERLKILVSENERLYITPVDPFASEHFITALNDGTVFDEETSLLLAYQQWLNGLSQESFTNGSNAYEIRNYFIDNERFPNNTNPEEKVLIKRRSQLDGLQLFSKFLFEAVTREDQQIIEHVWNSTYNAIKEYDYSRIPIGFEINRMFKNAPIDPRPALWDGVKFLTVNGSGIVAFDVGVGKTMTAILAMAQALYTGQCKRPLVIVPNPTYKKWISETIGEFNADGTIKVNGVLPQYRDRINDFYNLGVKYEKKLSQNWPKDFTITFITYEGLERLGFSANAKEFLGERLYTILNQGNLEARDVQKLRESIDSILGDVTSDTIANFDELGFDYIVCDEAHNFKKIFTRVKGRVDKNKNERETSPYQISNGEPSNRGLKLFSFTQWVLDKNNMRNVVLLTATPFTNSPLEIYSMLSLVAYQNLEKRGITNLIDFFDKFIHEESELSVTIRGKFEPRPVIKTFNNRQVLQNIIFSSIIYKTGEEAGVPRPVKVVYPYLKDERGIFLNPEERIETSLRPTPDQEYWLREIARFANQTPGNAIEPFVPKSMYDNRNRLLGRDLLAINLAKSVTLSPYLMRIGGEDGVLLYEKENPTYTEFIDSSPKLEYTMKCMQSVRNWHISRNEPVSGIILYMNMATGYFPLIKEYLVKKVGYDKKEVQIIIGGISQAKKERIKEKFLAGDVKVILGSATIKEGIDLQVRTTTLFNEAMDWNPTDITQLEGRAWRQGNIHSYVRIVTPLIENSLDVFLFQKLEEKTSRINDIWYRKGRGNVLKLEEFDPKELKMGLMTDPRERVRAEIELEITKLTNQQSVATGTITRINEAKTAIEELRGAELEINRIFETAYKTLEYQLNTFKSELTYPDLSKTKQEELQSKVNSLTALLERDKDDKTKIAVCKRYAKYRISQSGYGYDAEAYRIINTCDKQIIRFNLLQSIQKNVLEPKGLTMADDLQPIITQAETEARDIQAKIDELKSESYIDKRVQEITAEMLEKKRLSKSIDERVKEFESQNYLLSCLKGVHVCSLDTPEIKLIDDTPANKPEPAIKAMPASDAQKRLRIAKAKAAALALKLQLLEPVNTAA